MLKTIVWGADSAIYDDLKLRPVNLEGTAISAYPCMLFDILPALERLSIYDAKTTISEAAMGKVFIRGEGKAMKGPEHASIIFDDDVWAVGRD